MVEKSAELEHAKKMKRKNEAHSQSTLTELSCGLNSMDKE